MKVEREAINRNEPIIEKDLIEVSAHIQKAIQEPKAQRLDIFIIL